MSYMRPGSLRLFKDGEAIYVIKDISGRMDDFGCEYEDPAALCELVFNVLNRETEDFEWSQKITRLLAKNMGIEKRLLPKLVDQEAYYRRAKRLSRRDAAKHKVWHDAMMKRIEDEKTLNQR